MPESTNAVALKYNKEYLVIQANELVRSRQDNLSVLEAKLVRLAITQILSSDTEFRTYSCSIADLAAFLEISSQNIYRDVRNLVVDVMKKPIYIETKELNKKGKPNYKVFNWFDYAEYKDGTPAFRLSERLTPYLLGLKAMFTRYCYARIRFLPTCNAIRLFELITSQEISTIRENIPAENKGIIEVTYSINFLRSFFNYTDLYPDTRKFIARIIDASVNAINTHTFMRLSYTRVKRGRNVEAITFTFTNYAEGSVAWRERMAQVDAILADGEAPAQPKI